MSTGVGMSSCCLSGTLANGTPKGTVQTIDNIPTYVSHSPSNSPAKSIVFLADIFGWELPNIRLLADQYAKAGFTCYVPDVHNGDSLPSSSLSFIEPNLKTRESLGITKKAANTAKTAATLGPWLIKHRESVSRPIIEKFITAIREIPGTEKVGVIGFCWGGRYAILAAQKPFSGTPGRGVDAAYALHPSLVSIPGDFEPVVAPLSLALGTEDSLLGEKEIKKIKELMGKKQSGEQGEKSISEVVVYEDQVHGFALRGDWSSEKDKKAMDDAEKQGIAWFNQHLA